MERQRAVLELFSNLGKKGLVWTDAHIENIYFEQIGGKWTAGVLDSDMIVKFGEREANDFVMARLRKFELMPERAGIHSRSFDDALFTKFGSEAGLVSSERIYPSASYFMMKMLERGYIRYSPISGWHGVKIHPDEVEKYFKGFRNEVTGDPIRLEPAGLGWLEAIGEGLNGVGALRPALAAA